MTSHKKGIGTSSNTKYRDSTEGQFRPSRKKKTYRESAVSSTTSPRVLMTLRAMPALCFNSNQSGHFARQCPHPPKRKPDQLWAAHTEQPQESGEEGDREDMSNLSTLRSMKVDTCWRKTNYIL